MNIEFGDPKKWPAPRNRLRWHAMKTTTGWECNDTHCWYAYTDQEPTAEEKRAIEHLIRMKWEAVCV